MTFVRYLSIVVGCFVLTIQNSFSETTNLPRSYPDYLSAINTDRVYASACGPLSLFVIMKVVGVDINRDELEQHVREVENRGSTFSDLADIVSESGLHSVPIRCSLSSLRSIGLLAVMQTKDQSHFVAVTGYSENAIQIVDFPRPPEFKPFDSDDSLYNFLLVSRAPIPKVEPFKNANNVKVLSDSLTIEEAIDNQLHLGLVIGTRTVSYTLRNATVNTIELSDVRSSCRCLEAKLESFVIPAGDTTNLVVTLHGADRKDNFDGFLRIFEAPDENELLRLSVKGHLVNDVVFSQPALAVHNVEANSENVTIMPFRTTRTEPSVLDVHVLEGEFLIDDVSTINRTAGEFNLVWRAPSEPGWYRYEWVATLRESVDTVSDPVVMFVEVVDSK